MPKIAVVGTGIMGLGHIQTIAASKECTLCAVCDVKEESASALGKEYQVPWFTDYKEIA